MIRSHGAIWNWTHTVSETQADLPTAEPSRVAVDEKQITVDGEKKWLYAAIDTDSKLLLDIEVFSRRGTDPASAFLHRLTTTHDVSDTEFLVDAGGYLTALARRELSGHLDYSERNLIEKLFQTVTMRIDRFHSFWEGVQPAHGAGCDGSSITTIMTDRIKRSMDEHPPRRFSTRHCRLKGIVGSSQLSSQQIF
ncbi:transposase [Halococcus thailandensis JCM 13552]|uniref:Transposase n=1 Tax=Halococcus thailandensis JCM 13552 TaxID=1227457 RepID=M0MSG1_9EURY|nr:transposase [Halococcus thailandensis JCM 13552]